MYAKRDLCIFNYIFPLIAPVNQSFENILILFWDGKILRVKFVCPIYHIGFQLLC